MGDIYIVRKTGSFNGAKYNINLCGYDFESYLLATNADCDKDCK